MTNAFAATEIHADLIELRRALHQEPEIGLWLPLTQAKVLAALKDLPLEISTGQSLDSVTAVLRGGAVDRSSSTAVPAVLLRSDMDALPVKETAPVPYASKIDGVMHACGHDLHMAVLVGAARLLCAARDQLPGDVVFMFQPGEELPGGAEPMITEGVLDAAGPRVIAAYGLHVTSGAETHGCFYTRRGPLMASADSMHVTVIGRGGHGSMPFRAKDPIPAACEMVLALQTYVTRSHDIFDPVVVTVGAFHAGTADNIIPASATFSATVRSFTPAARARLETGLRQVCEGIAAAHSLQIDITWNPGYPPTVNHDREAEFIADTITDLFGANRMNWLANPEAGAEDFSYVLQAVPGAFVFLGACPPGIDPMTAPLNHAPDAQFDDAVLADGATLMASLAQRKLTSHSGKAD
jgi:hippurate hydrolase